MFVVPIAAIDGHPADGFPVLTPVSTCPKDPVMWRVPIEILIVGLNHALYVRRNLE